MIYNIYYYVPGPHEAPLPEGAIGTYFSIPIDKDEGQVPGTFVGIGYTEEQREIIITNHMLVTMFTHNAGKFRYFPN